MSKLSKLFGIAIIFFTGLVFFPGRALADIAPNVPFVPTGNNSAVIVILAAACCLVLVAIVAAVAALLLIRKKHAAPAK